MAREFFKVFHSYLLSIEPLDDAERGRLFTALINYSMTGEVPEMTGNEKFIFPTLAANINRDIEKYQATVERNKRNGAKNTPTRTQSLPLASTGSEDRRQKTEDGRQNTEDEIQKKEDEKFKSDCKHKTRSARFVPPTLEEVTAYVAERNSQVDPQGFIDFYSSKGWMVGKTKMTDWRAACRNAESWERWTRNTAKDLSYMDAWANGESVAVDFIDEEAPF